MLVNKIITVFISLFICLNKVLLILKRTVVYIFQLLNCRRQHLQCNKEWSKINVMNEYLSSELLIVY